jgi:hypothetical protein
VAASIRSVSSAGSGSVGSFTCAKPDGTAAGDVLVAFHTSDTGVLADMGTPTGGETWQPLASRAGDGGWAGTKLWVKVAGGSEPATYGFTQDAAGPADGVVAIVAIAGAATTTPIVTQTGSATPTVSVPTPGITPGGAADVELRWAASATSGGNVSWEPPAGFVERVDEQSGLFTSASLATRTLSSAASTDIETFTSSSPVFYHGFTVAVASAGGGDPGPTPIPDPTPATPSRHYRYVFADLLTDVYIGELDLIVDRFDRRISEAGTFSASMPITNATEADKVAAIVPRHPDDLTTGPGRLICHVYRRGIIWGSYVIWSATVSESQRQGLQVQFQGATLESYLAHVEIRTDLTYTGQDQIAIARSLLTSMQAQSSANIGLTLQTGTSGVPRDHTYLNGEVATYGQRLKELADRDNGFEWLIHTEDVGGVRTRTWQWGYPRLGDISSDHLWAQPGEVVAWQEDISALSGATSWRARGDSINTDVAATSTPLLSTPRNATDHLVAGWPRLDRTVDYSSVKDVDTLEAYAIRWAAQRSGALRVHQATIRLDGDEFTPANLGDFARLMLINDWWPRQEGYASFSKSWRVIGIGVNPPDRNGQETASLVFEEEVDI